MKRKNLLVKAECLLGKSQTGEKVLLDSIFTTSFYKVRNNYTNNAPIKRYRDWVKYQDEQINGQKSRSSILNINRQIKEIWLHTDPETLQLYKKGRTQYMTGSTLVGISALPFVIGTLLWAGTSSQDIDEDFTRADYNRQIKGGKIVTLISGGMLAVGVPLWIKGNKNRKKAINIYNETILNSIENREETSDLKINFTGNSIGLALTF